MAEARFRVDYQGDNVFIVTLQDHSYYDHQYVVVYSAAQDKFFTSDGGEHTILPKAVEEIARGATEQLKLDKVPQVYYSTPITKMFVHEARTGERSFEG